MRVNLSGREVRVTEQFLNGAQVGAVVEHVGREGVTQLVRCHVEREACPFEVRLQQPLHVAGLHGFSASMADNKAFELGT